MALRFNRRTNRYEDDGVPPPAPGSTVARDATVQGGLQTGTLQTGGGLTSTAGRRLAQAPAATFSFDRPVAAPAVIAGSPADNAAALQQASTFLDTGRVGKIGQADVPVDQQGKIAPGTRATTSSGGQVTVGVPATGSQPGTSGIFVNGRSVTHDASGQLVDAPVGKAPMSYADQQAEILRMYPEVGVAGSDANKKFVEAFQKGGSDQTGVLDLASSLFGPKTQAQAIAQDRAVKSRDATKAAADALANRTPEQVAADNAKAASNVARGEAAAREVYDPNNTGANVASTIKNAVAGGDASSISGYYGDPSTFGGGIVQGVKNFFGGFGDGSASAAATPTYPATQSAAVASDPTFARARQPAPAPVTSYAASGDEMGVAATAPAITPAVPAAPSADQAAQTAAIARNSNLGAPKPASAPPRNPLDLSTSAVAGALAGAAAPAPGLPVPVVPNPLDPDYLKRRIAASAPAAGY